MDAMEPRRVIALSDDPQNTFEGCYPDRVLSHVSRAEIHVYEIEDPKAQVLVGSGGGYVRIMHDREGVDVALWLKTLGFDAYVLVHHLPGAPGRAGVWAKDVALSEGLLAIEAIERDLPLFIIGLSSGGHLAGAIACQPHVNASGLVVAYAPVNANHRLHKVPADKPDYPPVEKQDFYDDWPIGLEDAPHGMPNCPVFLAYALHDSPVPIEHALNFIRAARYSKMDLDAHIFGQAPHGFALRDLDGSHVAWPRLAADWFDIKLKEAIA